MSRNRFQSAMIGSVGPRLLKATTALPNLLAWHATAIGGLNACSEQISGEISCHLSRKLANGRHHMRPCAVRCRPLGDSDDGSTRPLLTNRYLSKHQGVQYDSQPPGLLLYSTDHSLPAARGRSHDQRRRRLSRGSGSACHIHSAMADALHEDRYTTRTAAPDALIDTGIARTELSSWRARPVAELWAREPTGERFVDLYVKALHYGVQ